MFNWRKPEIPENQVAKFKPEPAAKPLFPSAAGATNIPSEAKPADALKQGISPQSSGPARIPTPPKEAATMTTRPHYPTPPSSSSSGNTPQPTVRTSIRPDTTERRVLVIGRGISITGTITDAERVVVEGSLESVLVRANEFSVAPGGFFKGEAEVEEAEVAGTVEGTVTARASLQVRAPGKLIGVARCRRLQVEDGGQITGKVEMLTDTPTAAPAPQAAPEPATAIPPAELLPSALPVKPDLIG